MERDCRSCQMEVGTVKRGQGAVERDRVFISEVTALVTARRTTRTHTHYVYYYQPVSLSLFVR